MVCSLVLSGGNLSQVSCGAGFVFLQFGVVPRMGVICTGVFIVLLGLEAERLMLASKMIVI